VPVLIGPLKTRFRWYPRNHRKHQKNEFCNVGPTQCGSTPPQYLLFSTHANPPFWGVLTPRKTPFFGHIAKQRFSLFSTFQHFHDVKCFWLQWSKIIHEWKNFYKFFFITKKKNFFLFFFFFQDRKFFFKNFFLKKYFVMTKIFFFAMREKKIFYKKKNKFFLRRKLFKKVFWLAHLSDSRLRLDRFPHHNDIYIPTSPKTGANL